MLNSFQYQQLLEMKAFQIQVGRLARLLDEDKKECEIILIEEMCKRFTDCGSLFDDEKRLSNNLEYCMRDIRRRHFKRVKRDMQAIEQLSVLTDEPRERVVDEAQIEIAKHFFKRKKQKFIEYLLKHGEVQTCEHYEITRVELLKYLSSVENRLFEDRKEVNKKLAIYQKFSELQVLTSFLGQYERGEIATADQIDSYWRKAWSVGKRLGVTQYSTLSKQERYSWFDDLYQKLGSVYNDCVPLQRTWLSHHGKTGAKILREARTLAQVE